MSEIVRVRLLDLGLGKNEGHMKSGENMELLGQAFELIPTRVDRLLELHDSFPVRDCVPVSL